MKMSSTISQPTATWPSRVSSRSESIKTRISTTVLATAIAMPSTAPVEYGIPNPWNNNIAATVANKLCTTAPGMATWRTASRSLRWK